MNTTEQVKTIATVPAALSLYGFGPGGRRRIPCPIHGGKNPNFAFNDHEWHCFKCGRGGDVIRFARDLFGLSFPDALSKLARDFGVEEERAPRDAPGMREYAQAERRFNERLAQSERAEREERGKEIAERSGLYAVLYRQLLRDPGNAELAACLDELEFELDFRIAWLYGRKPYKT
jgi:DNA primase